MLDFMVDHSHNGYSTSNQPNPKIPFSMGELVSSVSGTNFILHDIDNIC